MVDEGSRPADTRPVVIVDDDEAIRTALARLVRTFGYDSRIFATAEALLQEIGGMQPACVLTDLQMPGMNGIELVRELRRRYPSLPLLIMTAYPSLANGRLAHSAAATEYMTKPLDDTQLEMWLSRAIGKSEPQ